LRYCTYNRSSTFDLSKINVDSSIFGYDVHAGRYENLHTGNLSLGSSIAFVRHISFPPPPILNIYSTKMLGQETINVMGGNPYFTSPIINLHLPYGSTYRLILNGSYSIEITWTYDNSTYTYPAGYQTHLTITYDNN
jgi:hypothetical protein